MKRIDASGRTGKRVFAFVSDEDYELACRYSWCVDKDGYAIHYVPWWSADRKRHQRRLSLHRLIMGLPAARVDHRDGNRLNCQRWNLRLATDGQNAWNATTPKNNSSGFKGVCWDKEVRKWNAYITVAYKHKNLGRFNNPREAAMAYNVAAIEYFGEFARLNEL